MKKHKAARRRKRQYYPTIGVGEVYEVKRAECGKGVFYHTRHAIKPSRSKYTPHAGKKQLAKKAS